jgi:hypothetical protein
MYQQSQEAPTNSDDSNPSDEVQDADFEEIK